MMATELIRHRPAPPLDRFIECFWWSRRDQVLDCREHMLPSGSAQLVFALHETPPLVCSPAARCGWPLRSSAFEPGPDQ
jgi:hypothetical protein